MEYDSWVFRVKAYEGESLGHFLGRFRRANALSYKAIADHLGVRVEWVKAWESPSLRRNPTDLQLLALSKLVDVDCEHLTKMLPPSELHLQTRLCPVCYAEAPIHRVTWQQAGVECCDQHQLRLLSICPICKTGFRTPALWDDRCCERCKLPFGQMRSPLNCSNQTQ
jgi:transcriptional regulator with XRE-family HTH domain